MDNKGISNDEIFQRFGDWGIVLDKDAFRELSDKYNSGFEIGDHLYGEIPLSKRRDLPISVHDTCIEFAKILWNRLLENDKLDLFQFWNQFDKADSIDDLEDLATFYQNQWNTFVSFLGRQDTNTEQIIDAMVDEIDFYGTAITEMAEIFEAYTWQDRRNFRILNKFFSSFVRYFKDYFHFNPVMEQVTSYCYIHYTNGIWAIGKYNEAIKRYKYISKKFEDEAWTSYYMACCIIKDYERGKRNKAVNLHDAEKLLLKIRKNTPQEEMDLLDIQETLEKLQTCYLHLNARNKYDEIAIELKDIRKAIKEKFG